jgi:hypothetical protein
METYQRHIVYRRYAGPGARRDEESRPHASFDTLKAAVEYVGFADPDDQGAYAYSVIDVEHLYLGDMLKLEEVEHLVKAWLSVGRQRWEAAA